MTDQALIGRTLGHYRIEQQLGDGSMSSVFRATDVRLKRPVAIKVMHPHMAARPEFQQRFAQEARAAKRLDHASIVRVLDSGFDQGYLYLVMELVTGGSLRAYLQRLQAQHKIIELTEALELTRQIAEALDYAHREGMIHRDIKPDNVLLKLMTAGGHGTSRFRAVLTDFGLAKLAEGGVHSLTGQPMGTLPYMSPEQCLAEKVDARTDIYALGVMMYELVVGRLPYEPRSITQAIQMHTRDPLPPPADFRPDLPTDVVAILKKSLAKHPNGRFQQAGEMARAIQAVQTRIASGEPTMPEASSGPGENLKTYLHGRADPRADARTHLPDAHAEHGRLRPPHHCPRAGTDAHGPAQAGRNPHRAGARLRRRPRWRGVSRSHARLERGADGRYRITDLGSTNGTLLGDARLMPQVPEVWGPGRHGAHRRVLAATGGERRAADPPQGDGVDAVRRRAVVGRQRPRHIPGDVGHARRCLWQERRPGHDDGQHRRGAGGRSGGCSGRNPQPGPDRGPFHGAGARAPERVGHCADQDASVDARRPGHDHGGLPSAAHQHERRRTAQLRP
ncbi:MAG: protein kinase [Anaerolineae bacterium]|nr:protein kinase [Anaerolineae bacterium]